MVAVAETSIGAVSGPMPWLAAKPSRFLDRNQTAPGAGFGHFLALRINPMPQCSIIEASAWT